MKTNYAFSLGEVLLTLTIIGVIAAMTIPVVTMNSQQVSSEAGLKKAINTLDAALDLTKDDTKYMPHPKCFYWDQTSNEVDQPADYKGEFDQCGDLLTSIKDKMQTTQECNGSGCMPQYTITGPISVDVHGSAVDQNITVSAGCNAWKTSINAAQSWINSDGMIYFAYGSPKPGAALIGVDVNGKKGPNKWGYDVFSLTLKGNSSRMNGYVTGGCDFYEKGGKSGYQILSGTN